MIKFKAWIRQVIAKIFPESVVKLYDKYSEALWYIFFGVMTTLVNFVIYLIMTRLVFRLRADEIDGANALISNSVAWAVAVIAAFLFNRVWVFESKDVGRALLWQFFTFVAMRAASGVVEVILPSLAIEKLGVNDILAKAVVAVIIIILNYLFSKFISFKKKNDKSQDSLSKQQNK